MTGNPLAAAVQERVAVAVAAAVAAERVRVADEIRALLMDDGALRAWLAAHVLRDPGVGAVLAVLNRDLRGTCGMCRGPAAFIGEATDASVQKSAPDTPPTSRATLSP